MKKIILGLFIILFCFSLGTAKLQEEEPSKEEKVKAELYKKEELYFKTLNRDALEKLSKEELISEILALKELQRLIREENKLLDELVEMHKEKEKKKKFAWLDKYPNLKEEKDDLSWFNKYGNRSHPSTILVTKTDAEKLEEENDRLEELMREFRNEKSELEWDMMRYKSDLEWHMLELSSRLEFDLLFNPLLTFPFDYRYTYPSYSKKMDPINYEALLFTLSTDSKGKMDWTKYGWLKLLLKNK